MESPSARIACLLVKKDFCRKGNPFEQDVSVYPKTDVLSTMARDFVCIDAIQRGVLPIFRSIERFFVLVRLTSHG